MSAGPGALQAIWAVLVAMPWAQKSKSFLRRFFPKKAAPFLFSLKPIMLYVCGDASNIAKDVEAVVLTIVECQGGLARETAQDDLKSVPREKRYLRNVY